MTNHPAQRSGPARAWLDVPYADKDEAKAGGARWDPAVKRWYDPRPVQADRPRGELARWAARPDVPDLLPGEDRAFGSGLFVDLVPSSCWFTNVRTCVSQQDWERLRRMITRRAGQLCEICGRPEDRDTRRWLEAHERWTYNDATGVQALRRLICLCSDCHLTTHMGYANVTGRADQAVAHLRAVTCMTDAEARRHVDAAGELWTARSDRVWTLDLSMLTDAGVTLARPDTPPDRAAAARQALHDARQAVPQPGWSTAPPPKSLAPAPRRVESPAHLPTAAPLPRPQARTAAPRRSWLGRFLNTT